MTMKKRGHTTAFGKDANQASGKLPGPENPDRAYSRSSDDYEDGGSPNPEEKAGNRKAVRGFIASQVSHLQVLGNVTILMRTGLCFLPDEENKMRRREAL
jgi:hypothetical protein